MPNAYLRTFPTKSFLARSYVTQEPSAHSQVLRQEVSPCPQVRSQGEAARISVSVKACAGQESLPAGPARPHTWCFERASTMSPAVLTPGPPEALTRAPAHPAPDWDLVVAGLGLLQQVCSAHSLWLATVGRAESTHRRRQASRLVTGFLLSWPVREKRHPTQKAPRNQPGTAAEEYQVVRGAPRQLRSAAFPAHPPQRSTGGSSRGSWGNGVRDRCERGD